MRNSKAVGYISFLFIMVVLLFKNQCANLKNLLASDYIALILSGKFRPVKKVTDFEAMYIELIIYPNFSLIRRTQRKQ